MADLDVKLRQSNRLWDVPKMGAVEPWRLWLLELIPILLKPMLGRKRAVFVMFKNHPHLGVEVLTRIPLLRNNGKIQISSTHLHILNKMVPRIANKIIHGGTTVTLDGVEHRMVLSASQALVDIQPYHIMHNERIITSLLCSAGR
jgi:hypothetical protein